MTKLDRIKVALELYRDELFYNEIQRLLRAVEVAALAIGSLEYYGTNTKEPWCPHCYGLVGKHRENCAREQWFRLMEGE